MNRKIFLIVLSSFMTMIMLSCNNDKTDPVNNGIDPKYAGEYEYSIDLGTGAAVSQLMFTVNQDGTITMANGTIVSKDNISGSGDTYTIRDETGEITVKFTDTGATLNSPELGEVALQKRQ